MLEQLKGLANYRRRSTPVRGGDLSYFKIGKGKKYGVLIHGFGLTGRMWLPLVLRFLNEYTFVVPDMPGHGRSYDVLPWSDQGFLTDYAECIGAVIKNEQLVDYKLASFSIGAYASLEFLLGGGPAPEKYLHIEHTPFPQTSPNWRGGMNPALLNRFEELHELINGRDLTKMHFSDLPDDVRKKYHLIVRELGRVSMTSDILRFLMDAGYKIPMAGKHALERVSWPWGHAIIEGYRTGCYDLRPRLSELTVPTLLVAGTQNSLFEPEGMRYMNSVMPNAELIELPSNHDVPVGAAGRFYSLFREFLA